MALRTRESVSATALTAPARGRRYAFTKRGMDLVGAALLVVVSAPVFVLVAVLVRVTSPGPVFFRQERVGLNGETFRVLKFRTMVDSWTLSASQRAEFERAFKLRNDPRVTPLGRFLRKSSLDELPQLLNVLRGEMSIVGPRPVVQRELDEMYAEDADAMVSVRPGMTGLWQVSGRSSLPYAERVRLDLQYVERQSLWLDLQLIARTPLVVLIGRGAL